MLLHLKTPLIFGIIATATLAGYLFVYHPLPDALSRAHAQIIPGSDIHSCDQCHTPDGLTAGCLTCHTEIAGQLENDRGYHAYLAQSESLHCGSCHPEHHGEAFVLVSVLSWPGRDPNSFDHPHCDYRLTGHHDQLSCAECHENKRSRVFSLPDFPEYPRPSTFLGLSQECLICHVDVHAWPSERACLDCHDQVAFSPAPVFRHEDVFALQGPHAEIDCAACHPVPESGKEETAVRDRTPGSLPYHQVTGQTCEECHSSPHRTGWEAGCESCHLGRDFEWNEAVRRMDVEAHQSTSFPLTGHHTAVACIECHSADEDYLSRYPDPQAKDYQRQPDTCQGCHEDPHQGKLKSACTTCHQTTGWKAGDLLFDHDRNTDFALDAVHETLSCQECHGTEDLTYRAKGAECAVCHEVQADAQAGKAPGHQIEPDPHFGRVVCSDCHDMTIPKQVMAGYARRCAECHNDRYASLALQWAQALQQRQSAVERFAQQLSDTRRAEIDADLSEATDCGFHHLRLALQIYDRLLEALRTEAGGGVSTIEKEAP